MAYFHAKFVKSKGGTKRRVMRLVLGETIDEILTVARRWPEATTINLPPRTSDAWKSKSLPQLHVDADREDILQELDSAEVSAEHVKVMTFQLREDWFRSRCGRYMTEEIEKFFRTEIRGKLILLLRAGAWVDEPENLGLQNWNKRIENYDLGRRSDLKFSSNPISLTEVQHYDQDLKREDTQEEESWLTTYRNATDAERIGLFTDLPPWRKNMVREMFGEP
jgi:hypothetical protein